MLVLILCLVVLTDYWLMTVGQTDRHRVIAYTADVTVTEIINAY